MTKPGKKYRKKPVVIEALQYTGSNQVRLKNWLAAHGAELTLNGPTARVSIETLEGHAARVSRGDWIVMGVKGEFYPVKHDVFLATYEEVKPDE